MLDHTNTTTDRPVMPTEIAESVVLASSYTDEKRVHEGLAWLRENMPLGIAELPGFDPIFVVSKHADIMEIEKNPQLFASMPHNPILNSQASDNFLKSVNGGSIRILDTLTFMDPPEHTEIRNISAPWFMPGRMKKLEDDIRAIARQSVANLMDFDGECDFVRDFALLFPLRVVMSIFGVPPEDEPYMLKLTQEFFGTQDPDEVRENILEEADPAAAAKQWQVTINDFFGYFSSLSADRRLNPRDDLASAFAAARDANGEYYSDAILNGYYVAIATAGHDTTSSTSAGGMEGLIAFPDQFRMLRDDPASLAPGFVDEAIRWTSPVKHFMRAATGPAQVRGVPIRPDDRFFLSFPSANRDSDVFDRPFDFDMTRKPNRHLAFGFGPHVCLGQHLAKLELRILFEELMPRLRSIELAGDLARVQTNFVGGLKSMPVRFTKA